jgi:hypothetical protein
VCVCIALLSVSVSVSFFFSKLFFLSKLNIALLSVCVSVSVCARVRPVKECVFLCVCV